MPTLGCIISRHMIVAMIGATISGRISNRSSNCPTRELRASNKATATPSSVSTNVAPIANRAVTNAEW